MEKDKIQASAVIVVLSSNRGSCNNLTQRGLFLRYRYISNSPVRRIPIFCCIQGGNIFQDFLVNVDADSKRENKNRVI